MRNNITINNNICIIDLCNRTGKKTREAIFDKKFIDKVKEFRWSAYKHRNTYYVVTNIPKDKQFEYGKTRLKLHQLILPCIKLFIIDHKNHNGLDNRLANLRIVTNRVNCENRGKQRNKYSLVGVHYHKRDKVWYSNIQVKGKINM